MLRSLLSLALVLAVPRSARADDCLGPGHVRLDRESPADDPTLDALRELLGPSAPSEDVVWVLTVAGARTTVRHREGDRFARTLEGSSPYARALAAAELLNAARAAVCSDEEVPEAGPDEREVEGATLETTSQATPSLSVAFALGTRFDADVGGPWLVRPMALLDVSVLRGEAVFLSFSVEASLLGFYGRASEQRDDSVTVRYERHDLNVGAGLGLSLGALTLIARVIAGVSIRDVTALDEVALASRLDVGATLGGGVSLRVPLVGPLGLRLAADVMGVPTTFTYRVLGEAIVIEQPVRIGTLVALDVEWP